MRASLAVFFAVAFAFSWAIAAVVALLPEPVHPLTRVALLALFMFGPALGALAAQRLRREPVRALGLRLAPNRWWLAAWLLPPMLAFVTAGVGLLVPGVEASADMSGLLERLAPTLTAAQLEEARATLARIPPLALFAAQLAQALVAAVSVNAVAAFGEELGWRGFLHERLRPVLSFWPRSVVIGAVWGVWHAPIILLGHNYPQHRVVGVFMMVAFCVLLAPLFEHLRERTGSVLAASVAHGSINASAGFAVMFLRGGSDLAVGMTGAAGFVVLAAINAALWWSRRRANR